MTHKKEGLSYFRVLRVILTLRTVPGLQPLPRRAMAMLV